MTKTTIEQTKHNLKVLSSLLDAITTILASDSNLYSCNTTGNFGKSVSLRSRAVTTDTFKRLGTPKIRPRLSDEYPNAVTVNVHGVTVYWLLRPDADLTEYLA